MGSDPRILVIAPDDGVIGPLCQGLDALGWRTVTARTLAGAIQVLIDWPLETVILDSALPDAALANNGPMAGSEGTTAGFRSSSTPSPVSQRRRARMHAIGASNRSSPRRAKRP